MFNLDTIFADYPNREQDHGDKFAFPRGITFSFVGIIIFYLLYYITSWHKQFSDLPPFLKLLVGQLPFFVFSIGGALLGLREDLRLCGWRKVLDMPVALPYSRSLFFKTSIKWSCLLVIACAILNVISIKILTTFRFDYFPRQLIDIYGPNAGLSFWITAFISAVIIAPVSEEILFRRILYQGLRKLNISYAGIITALLFSMLHAIPQGLLSYILISLVLQKACREKSLWIAIAIHAGYNLIGITAKIIIIFCL